MGTLDQATVAPPHLGAQYHSVYLGMPWWMDQQPDTATRVVDTGRAMLQDVEVRSLSAHDISVVILVLSNHSQCCHIDSGPSGHGLIYMYMLIKMTKHYKALLQHCEIISIFTLKKKV